MIKLLIAVPLGVAFALWAIIAFIAFDPAWIMGTDGPARAALFLIWAFLSLGVLSVTS